jgi:hypothetical protein
LCVKADSWWQAKQQAASVLALSVDRIERVVSAPADVRHLRDCNGNPCECGADAKRFVRGATLKVGDRVSVKGRLGVVTWVAENNGDACVVFDATKDGSFGGSGFYAAIDIKPAPAVPPAAPQGGRS